MFQLFADGMAQYLCKSFYPDTTRDHQPQFLTNGQGGFPDVSGLPQEKQPEAWCRFQVQNFSHTHFAKDPFPPFTIDVSQLNGDPLPRVIVEGKPKPMADTRIRLSVHNKWADVSNEVLPDTEFVRVLKDGQLEMNDLVFQDVSLKHGGYFIMHIDPIDFSGELQPWRSPKFMIQSVKTHCIKKRKMAAHHKAMQRQKAEALEPPNPDMNSSPAFNPQIPQQEMRSDPSMSQSSLIQSTDLQMAQAGKGVLKGVPVTDNVGTISHQHQQNEYSQSPQQQQNTITQVMPPELKEEGGLGY